MSNPIRILLIEDEIKLLATMHQSLIEQRFLVDTAADGRVGLALAQKNNYAVIVSDVICLILQALSFCKNYVKKAIIRL